MRELPRCHDDREDGAKKTRSTEETQADDAHDVESACAGRAACVNLFAVAIRSFHFGLPARDCYQHVRGPRPFGSSVCCCYCWLFLTGLAWAMASILETPPKKRALQDELPDTPDQPKVKQPVVKQRKLDRLSPSQRKQLTLLGKGVPGNRQGLTYDTSDRCSVCERAKHSCDWDYRRGGTAREPKRMVTGSLCGSCVKGCHALRICRSLPILEQVAGVLDVLRSVSSEIAAGNPCDVCRCSDCGGKL